MRQKFLYCVGKSETWASMVVRKVMYSLKKNIRRYQHLESMVYCHLCKDDKRRYWQLDFGSKLTLVSLYLYPTVFETTLTIFKQTVP